jgi:hypothetical protein
MYNVNWNAPVNSAVIQLPDFVVMHVELLKFKTPLEGLQGFALVHRGTGVRMFEGVDIAYVVRKAVAEQNLMDHIRKDPELGVEHAPGQTFGDLTTPTGRVQ